jgi:pectinesterase
VKGIIMALMVGLILTQAFAQKQIIVAQDGSGNFKKVQEAIDVVKDNLEGETVIFIKKGIYKEKLVLPFTKQHVTLKGEGPMSTILTYDDYAAKKDIAGKNIGTSGSASIHIYGKYFSAYDLTFENSAGPVGQAVAAWVGGDKAYFQNCRFIGFQDTLYTYGANTLQCYHNCYIEGTVDFIFGAATAWFEECRIFCKNNGGYITAASTPDSIKYGYVFNKCSITGESPAQSYFLGRPWRPFARTIFMRCNLGNQIKSEGWSLWSNQKEPKTTFYAEFKNVGKGSDTARRAVWTFQLTKKEAAAYTIKKVLKNWQPITD